MPVDTFSHIRSLLESQETVSPCDVLQENAGKVIARSRGTFVTERPQKSLDDYKRRCRHRYTGFDSFPHVPYKPFADLRHTDAYTLVADTWGISLDEYANGRDTSASASNKDCTRVSSHVNNHHTIRVVREQAPRDGKEKTAIIQSKTAGLSAIQLQLNSSARAVREVAAGSAFYDTLPREEKRKRFLQKMRAPRQIIKEDGVCVPVHNPSIFLSLLVNTAGSKTCLAPLRPAGHQTALRGKEQFSKEKQEMEELVPTVCQRVGPNTHIAVAAAHFKMNYAHAKKKEISPAKKLQMRNCLVKMKTIYSLLCSLYNMKTKELKEKHPLSLEALKQMSVKPLPHKEGTHHHSHRLTTYTHNVHHTSSFHFHTKRSCTTVKTWEDLLTVERGVTVERGGGPAGNSHREPGDPSSCTVPPPSPHLDPQTRTHTTTRFIPPWQRQVVFVDHNEKSNDPAVVMKECLEGFQATKNQVSEQTKAVLGKRESTSVQALGVKARELRLGVDRENCLRQMREIAYDVSRTNRASEQKPTWHTKLEKEVAVTFKPGIVGSDGQSNTWKTVAKWFIHKLQFFLFADFDTIPRVMEKLCLLVMSLPPDQLCLAPVLESFQFVLEEVLELPAQLCRQWLEMRGLSVIGVPLPSKPIIILGLTV